MTPCLLQELGDGSATGESRSSESKPPMSSFLFGSGQVSEPAQGQTTRIFWPHSKFLGQAAIFLIILWMVASSEWLFSTYMLIISDMLFVSPPVLSFR